MGCVISTNGTIMRDGRESTQASIDEVEDDMSPMMTPPPIGLTLSHPQHLPHPPPQPLQAHTAFSPVAPPANGQRHYNHHSHHPIPHKEVDGYSHHQQQPPSSGAGALNPQAPPTTTSSTHTTTPEQYTTTTTKMTTPTKQQQQQPKQQQQRNNHPDTNLLTDTPPTAVGKSGSTASNVSADHLLDDDDVHQHHAPDSTIATGMAQFAPLPLEHQPPPGAAAINALTATEREMEDELSEISSTSISASISTDLAAGGSGAPGGAAGGRRVSQVVVHASVALPSKLEKERDQAPPTVEEEYFEYDDIKIFTDELKSNRWRLAGRKPVNFAAGGGGGGGPSHTTESINMGNSGRRDSLRQKSSTNKFVYMDFTVDEIDMIDTIRMPTARRSSISVGGNNGGTTPTQTASLMPSDGVLCVPAAAQQSSSGGVSDAANTESEGQEAADESTAAAAGVDGTLLAPVDTAALRHQRVLEASIIATARKIDPGTVRHCKVRTLIGHSSRVKCMAVAPSEREFVSCSNEDASITLNSVETGREIGIFTGHQDTVIHTTFSHDGKYLATTSRDHTMVLWDVVTAKQLLTFDHAKVVICCVFSKDSRYVATGCQDKVCRLWETRRGRECLVFAQHEGIIISMSYAPDNTAIVSASADKTLRVWSTTTAKCKYLLSGHVGIVLSCNYTNDGRFIVSNDERLVKVWSMADGSCTQTIAIDELTARLRHMPPTGAKKLSWTLSSNAPGAFNRYFIAAANTRFLYVLDIETGEEVFHVYCKAPVYSLTTGPRNIVGFGDSFGNAYLLTLSS